MINELRKVIKAEIERSTGLSAFFVRASADATYPYITFEIREVASDSIEKHEYTIIADGWDKNEVKDLIQVFDALDEKFKRYKNLTDEFCIQIYHGGTREFIEDDDREMRHLLRNYDMTIYERSEKQ